MKITVITVTYNRKELLKDAIESVLRQTYYNIEYIIIDGGSSDGTIEMLIEYERRFNGKMKWISEKDDGIYDAMNKGISLSTGDIIGFLNSDDFLNFGNIIEEIVKCFNQNSNIDAIYGDTYFVKPDNIFKPIRYYSSKRFKRWMMLFGYMPDHMTFYAKRECYDKYGVFSLEYKIAADFELLLRFIYCNKIRTKYIPIIFATIRTGGLSTSGFDSYKNIIKDQMRAFKDNNVRSCTILLLKRFVYKIFTSLYIPKRFKETAKTVRKSTYE